MKNTIDKILEYTTQHQLELLLGLSHGYISRIRSGKKTPSMKLASYLKFIANNNPKQKLREIEASWGGPPLGDRKKMMKEVLDFLINSKETTIFPKSEWKTIEHTETKFLIIGEILDVPKTRLLLYPSVDETTTINHAFLMNAVYVDADWSEQEYTDLIVASYYGIDTVKEDWPYALELARKRANVKKEVKTA